MMHQPVRTISREATIAQAARIMVDQKIGCILVVDLHGRLRGIVTQTDFGGDQHRPRFQWRTSCRDSAGRSRQRPSHKLAKKHGPPRSNRSW